MTFTDSPAFFPRPPAVRVFFLLFMPLAMLLGGCTRKLVYYPANPPEAELQESAAASGLEPWTDASGERIGWVARAESESPISSRSAMLVFHGNAGHALQRVYYADGFNAPGEGAPWDVYLFEYPGYGSREGTPSEQTIKQSALSASETLQEADYDAFYLTGESLGSGVACHVAGELPEAVAGVFLVTPFTSLHDVARAHYPAILVRMILNEHYDNEEALRSYNGRLAILLAGADDIIPPDLGRQLYESYNGPKQLWVQEGRTHNTLSLSPETGFWREVCAFLAADE